MQSGDALTHNLQGTVDGAGEFALRDQPSALRISVEVVTQKTTVA